MLRSSFSRGRHGTRYPYSLCQTKGCEAYGKSIKRDTLEDEVGQLIKQLEPAPILIEMAAAMFRRAWTHRLEQAANAMRVAKQQIADLDRDIAKTLDRILKASNETVIRAYEAKVADLEKRKALLTAKTTQMPESRGTMEHRRTGCLFPRKLLENMGEYPNRPASRGVQTGLRRPHQILPK
ncbi:MAG: hypothetical protein AAGE03_03325 [Pseudomonadota bacterium]